MFTNPIHPDVKPANRKLARNPKFSAGSSRRLLFPHASPLPILSIGLRPQSLPFLSLTFVVEFLRTATLEIGAKYFLAKAQPHAAPFVFVREARLPGQLALSIAEGACPAAPFAFQEAQMQTAARMVAHPLSSHRVFGHPLLS
jgi:hypothetical protein